MLFNICFENKTRRLFIPVTKYVQDTTCQANRSYLKRTFLSILQRLNIYIYHQLKNMQLIIKRVKINLICIQFLCHHIVSIKIFLVFISFKHKYAISYHDIVTTINKGFRDIWWINTQISFAIFLQVVFVIMWSFTT